MKTKAIVCALIMAFGLSSCATIFTGTKDTLTFNTNPSGVDVYIDGIKICTTPCTTPVKRSLSEQDVEFRLDGYKTQIITLDREFNVVSILNIGGLLGWVVDAATGAIFKYDRKVYDVDMELDKVLSQYNVQKIELDTENKVATLQVAMK
ncbi:MULTISPECIES: PEGA domain-containing protein [Porphyromonas]|uniref:PEGA domain-containing protein n=1 Tax=Porphyromonas TaxID=836 RepID=UPI001B8BA7B3|nr:MULTISPECIES: PEGA domain-containing protein [Porphyromonas]MDD7437800.1 PEGA domain-containing protein [Bacteroidales bacterium]MBR8704180.1 hypothetical protein [Porphyromonas levii]MBR8712423.1 hypothetical protein [Porphyromonas levii]MBR8714406.1 hypothetical protein [Porphyromonas levii]MBR8726947.1 hypothetical protein [Porphyromonas levii]